MPLDSSPKRISLLAIVAAVGLLGILTSALHMSFFAIEESGSPPTTDRQQGEGGPAPSLEEETVEHPTPVEVTPTGTAMTSTHEERIDRERAAEDNAWAGEMQWRVYNALAESEIVFTSITVVKCARPNCEIQYTATDTRSVAIMNQLTRLLGADNDGMPVVKTMALRRREIYPGTKVSVLTFSTE